MYRGLRPPFSFGIVMTEKKTKAKPKKLEVYAVRKFTKNCGNHCVLGEKIEGTELYKTFLLKNGLVSTKKG